ncbi:hypothetical protein UNSWCD_245 [Campylobacter concisus UNSWCD]|uniref:hypothetical protein n=1 Tax=Campylobacter concisus TaxID=199 RepID=UPI00025A6AF7|nr:hypothetical protein [Campylobacter concisus]EIF07269.1 hypothetical protein UNSWCD_245 [Campylobacter concisus UNSWCD]
MKNLLLVVFAAFALCGCAPKGIFVSLPDEQAPSNVSKKTKIYVESVKDVRAFENNPKQASTPSLYKHNVNEVSAKEKQKYIGRTRNGYGKGLWNVILENNQNVSSVLRAHIEEAFKENGYQIVKDKSQIDENTLTASAKIDKFWAYIVLGFSKVGLNMDIDTLLSVKDKEIKTDLKRSEFYFLVTNDDFINIIKSSLAEYKEKLVKQISELNLE